MWAVTGIWNDIVAIATTSDVAMVVVAGLIIVAAGLLMRGVGTLGTVTLAALAVFALANYANGVALKGENAVAAAGTGWQKLIDLQGGMMIAYFVGFAVLIALAYFVRSMLFSR